MTSPVLAPVLVSTPHHRSLDYQRLTALEDPMSVPLACVAFFALVLLPNLSLHFFAARLVVTVYFVLSSDFTFSRKFGWHPATCLFSVLP